MTPALVLLSVLVFTAPCAAQEQFAFAITTELLTLTASLKSEQRLGVWQRNHPQEISQPAGYEASDNWLASDLGSLHTRCSFSVAHPTVGLTRIALFHVPIVLAGELAPLPDHPIAALVQSCRLQEVWLETRESVSLDSLVRILSVSWGQPNGPSQSFRDAVWSVGKRKNIVAWHRAGMTIWMVPDRKSPTQVHAIYARNDIVPAEQDWYDSIRGLQDKVRTQSAATLAKIAAIDPVLTQAVLSRTICGSGSSAPQESPSKSAKRLEQWLEASKTLPPRRRAAALLLAEYYIPCLNYPLPAQILDRYTAMGIQFNQNAEWTHTLRDQARVLDAHGNVGEWAALYAFWEKCNIAYNDVIKTGEDLAQSFPEWRANIRYALGRAHEARLSLSYPRGPAEPPDLFPPVHLSASEMKRERTAAVRDFQSFLGENPYDPEAVFAWQEVWRLQAGLKPTRVPFGCSGE